VIALSLLACLGTVEDLSATVSPHVVTVVTLRWTTDEPTAGQVFYGLDGQLDRTVVEGAAVTDHEVVLLGLPANTAVSYVVVVPDEGRRGTSDVQTVTTGVLPSELPGFEATGEAPTDTWHGVPVLGATTAALILDSDGQPIWYHLDESGLDVYRVRLSRDRRSVLYNAASIAGDPTEPTALVRVSLDGSVVEETPIPLLAHDFVELPDGTLALLVVHYGEHEGTEVRGDAILELAPDGTQTTVWTSWDCFDPAVHTSDEAELGWTFGNALDYDPATDSYLLGMRNFSSIARIDRATGTCPWVVGDTAATIEPAECSAGFRHQHQFQLFDDTLLVFDNDGATAQESRVLTFGLDEGTGVATQLDAHRSDDGLYVFVLGDVHRFGDGSTRITWSSAGQIDHVSATGETVWSVNTDFGYAFGFNTVIEDLYADQAGPTWVPDTTGSGSASLGLESGEVGRVGAGVYTGDGYSGTEELALVAEEGWGADVCRVGMSLTSTASRTDCDECAWAFDLVVSDAQVLTDDDPDCLHLLGLDLDDVSALDGATVSYGFQEEFIGHAAVLMTDRGSGLWEPLAYVVYDEETGEFTYDWEDGCVSY
jgi:hypothetical protein